MAGWQVETRDAGTCFIPGEVVPVPDWLKPGIEINALDSAVFLALRVLVMDYVPGFNIESISAIEDCYFARLSAPGYLDCTEWGAFKTLREARAYLRG